MISARAQAAKKWLESQRQIAAGKKFHQFEVRTDRRMPVVEVVNWFNRFTEFNAHNVDQKVYLSAK